MKVLNPTMQRRFETSYLKYNTTNQEFFENGSRENHLMVKLVNERNLSSINIRERERESERALTYLEVYVCEMYI